MDYFAHPWDFRRAVLAFVVTGHVADYFVMESYRGDDSRAAMGRAVRDGRKRLRAKFPNLEKITDAADAAKRGRLASPMVRPRHVERVDQLKTSPSLFTAPFGHGVFAEAANVFVRAGGGSEFSARLQLSRALDFWRSKLATGTDDSTNASHSFSRDD